MDDITINGPMFTEMNTNTVIQQCLTGVDSHCSFIPSQKFSQLNNTLWIEILFIQNMTLTDI